jgi:hypothetical protein
MTLTVCRCFESTGFCLGMSRHETIAGGHDKEQQRQLVPLYETSPDTT